MWKLRKEGEQLWEDLRRVPLDTRALGRSLFTTQLTPPLPPVAPCTGKHFLCVFVSSLQLEFTRLSHRTSSGRGMGWSPSCFSRPNVDQGVSFQAVWCFRPSPRLAACLRGRGPSLPQKPLFKGLSCQALGSRAQRCLIRIIISPRRDQGTRAEPGPEAGPSSHPRARCRPVSPAIDILAQTVHSEAAHSPPDSLSVKGRMKLYPL